MRGSIAMTDAQAGWIIGTAFAVPYGVTALASALALRGRRAPVWWLVAGVVMWTTASAATGAARSVSELTLLRAALGVGQAMFVPVAIAWILDDAGTSRARALATFTSGSTIGRSVALLTVGALLSLLAVIAQDSAVAHWRWLFVLTALPNLALLPLLARVRGAATVPGIDVDDRTVVAVEWRTLALFFGVSVMPVVLIQAMAGWLPTLLVRDRALAPAQAATLLGAVTLAAAPAGQILGGWLMTRMPGWHDRIPTIVLGSLAVTLVPLAAVVWAPGLAGAVAGVAAVTLIVGVAAFCGLFGVQLLVPAAARASVNGVYLAFVTLVGVGAGPLLTGALATVGGGVASALGKALLVTGVIATLLCALAVVAVQGRYRRHCRA